MGRDIYMGNSDSDELLTIDGHDDAWLGVCTTWDAGSRVDRGVYDGQVMLATLIADGMDEEGAMEYIDFNIEGAYVGRCTPIILWRTPYNG